MKPTFFITFLLFLFLSCNNINHNSINISGLKKEYYTNDILNFKIENKSNVKLYTSIGIQFFTDNRWYEIINDIEEPNGKIEIIKEINKNQTKEFQFDLNHTKDLIERSNMFQVFIYYGNPLDEYSKHKITSSTFKVLK